MLADTGLQLQGFFLSLLGWFFFLGGGNNSVGGVGVSHGALGQTGRWTHAQTLWLRGGSKTMIKTNDLVVITIILACRCLCFPCHLGSRCTLRDGFRLLWWWLFDVVRQISFRTRGENEHAVLSPLFIHFLRKETSFQQLFINTKLDGEIVKKKFDYRNIPQGPGDHALV